MERLSGNTTGITVFDKELSGGKLYQQYKKLQWLRDFQLVVDNMKQDMYFNKLVDMWETIDVAESDHQYLTFYTKWLFGIFRPLSGASLSEYFDTGKSYDTNQIYDDALQANGLITAEQYLKYIKFIIDYSKETWTLDYILSFVADFCEISPNEIEVDYKDKTEIKVILPNTTTTNEFVKLELNYRDAMGLPFGNVITFQVKLNIGLPRRYIVYSPYSKGFSLFDSGATDKVSSYSVQYKKGDLLIGQKTSVFVSADPSLN